MSLQNNLLPIQQHSTLLLSWLSRRTQVHTIYNHATRYSPKEQTNIRNPFSNQSPNTHADTNIVTQQELAPGPKSPDAAATIRIKCPPTRLTGLCVYVHSFQELATNHRPSVCAYVLYVCMCVCVCVYDPVGRETARCVLTSYVTDWRWLGKGGTAVGWIYYHYPTIPEGFT